MALLSGKNERGAMRVPPEFRRFQPDRRSSHAAVDAGTIAATGFDMGEIGPQLVLSDPPILVVRVPSGCPVSELGNPLGRKTEFRSLPYTGSPLAAIDECDSGAVADRWVSFTGRDVTRVSLKMDSTVEHRGEVRLHIDEYHLF